MIAANAFNVCDTRMATTLSADGTSAGPKVKTVEHLLSACSGLGVDNLVVDITAEEVPILDGSAASFVFLLQSAGIVLQDAPKRFLRVLRAVEVREGEGNDLKWARLEPFEGYTLGFEIEFDHPVVSETGQRFVFDMGSGRYKNEIARARTFGFTKDVEMMRARGLALGGSLDNAVVVDEFKVLNSGGLRYDDEFVKHKILDAIGDLRARRPPAAGRVQRVQVGPRAQQQARARALERPLGVGDRHLRRRDDRTCGPRGARSRVVSRSSAARCSCSRRRGRQDAGMFVTVLRWSVGVLAALLAFGALFSLAIAVVFDNDIWSGRARQLRSLLWVLALAWFNAEVWGRVVYTLVHWV